MSELSVRYDAPIPAEEARIRGIDQSLSRIVIDGDVEALAEILHRSCPPGEAIFVSAIGGFVSLSKLQTEFSKLGIEVHIEQEFLKVKDDKQLSIVFARWEAEQLAVFFGTEITANEVIKSLPKLQAKWWKLSQEGYEAPYLKQSNLIQPIFFFSPTRSSVEAIGGNHAIIELLGSMQQRSTT